MRLREPCPIVCIHANFTHIKILSCERKVNFAYIRKFINYVI